MCVPSEPVLVKWSSFLAGTIEWLQKGVFSYRHVALLEYPNQPPEPYRVVAE
jgi:hypothetical protein